MLSKTREQVLTGVLLSGSPTLHPRTNERAWSFYREMVDDGLVAEEALGDGQSRFSITNEGMLAMRRALRRREATDELAALREDGPDGIDDRAREVWQQAVRDLEEELAAL